MAYPNLPGVKLSKNDGNLAPTAAARAPRVLIIGTAGQGQGDELFLVPTTSQAKSEFGNEGTLIRGMWEALKTGAEEVALYRIGSTSAVLDHVGDSAGSAGYRIETVTQDASAGTDYALYFDDTSDRLVVRRNTDNLVVWDNNPSNPIDLFEVVVSGYRAAAGGPDIGSASGFINLASVDPSTYAGTEFTAGTDGLSLSRMEMYEELYVAYKNLMSEAFDVIVPMDVYLDDYNIVNQGHFKGAVSPVIPVGQQYPTAGAFSPTVDVDSLGKVFVEEYEGEFYFWWDTDGDGVAEVFPTPAIGSSSSTTKIDGTTLTTADFHEVNFGYQLSRFLYDYSEEIVDATGVIGVLPPDSNSLRDRARWLGQDPTWTLNTNTGEYYIAAPSANGTGLLGNKFMVGRFDHRSGAFGGGMILTDTQFMDGTEQVDDNSIAVDLGKYISVVSETAFLRNNWYPAGYRASIASSYAGFYIGLPPSSAPTNKNISGSSIIYKMAMGAYDSLTGAGYVSLRNRPLGGTVVTDAPTATLPNSDWRRLSTVRIVKEVVDRIRSGLDPFIGEGTGASVRASMESVVGEILLQAKRDGYLQDYKEFSIIQTPQQEVLGVVEVNLTLIPAFEIRQINLTVSLSKSG